MALRPSEFSDLSLLLLRAMTGVVFASSGWNDLRDPEARSQSIGQSKGFTIFLGAAEILGSVGLVLGVFARPAALGLILIMLGAIQKKAFGWRTGFWGKKNGYGWHYDLMLISMCLVVLTTGGGRLVLWN
ncbi:MAG TPA: DoxX family protein [Candidatus Dormibacteraeota bacterium]|nr:DoxX family protein [Candidatus Dormibacteraeota bacterium]